MAPIATTGGNGASSPVGSHHEQMRRASTGQVPGEVDTEFFIVGAGPAGASLAGFLASYGRQLFPSLLSVTNSTDHSKVSRG